MSQPTGARASNVVPVVLVQEATNSVDCLQNGAVLVERDLFREVHHLTPLGSTGRTASPGTRARVPEGWVLREEELGVGLSARRSEVEKPGGGRLPSNQ